MSIAIAGKTPISLTQSSGGQISQALSLDDFFNPSCEGYALIDNGNGLLCTTNSVPDNRFSRWSPIKINGLELLTDEVTLTSNIDGINAILEEIARRPRYQGGVTPEDGLGSLSKNFGVSRVDVKGGEYSSSTNEYFYLKVSLDNTNKINGKPAQGVLFPLGRTMAFNGASWEISPDLKFARGSMKGYITLRFKKQFIAIDHHGNVYLAKNVK